MAFQVRKAVREKVYVKLALMGPSGCGKSYSSLKLATGMANEIKKETGKDAKILVANTESSRGLYYANEFEYDIVDVEAPHNPEKYVELIGFAVSEGYDILIIDSSSPEWEGKGGCLEIQQQAGGTYQAWSKVTPRHNKFISAISDSPIHIIATMRGKDQYEIEKDNNGKTSVKKLGVGAKQRESFEYEFTCTFLIDQKTHMAESQKDNTHIFEKDPQTLLSDFHGERIIKWANSSDVPSKSETSFQVKEKSEVETDSLDYTLQEISNTFKSKISEGIDKTILYDVVKKYHNSMNFLNIKDVEVAKKVLKEIVEVK